MYFHISEQLQAKDWMYAMKKKYYTKSIEYTDSSYFKSSVAQMFISSAKGFVIFEKGS